MSEPQYGYTFRASRSCDVVNEDCKAPPALAGSFTRATCFRCGNPVCVTCSRLLRYLRYGRRRICDNCRDELERN